MADLVKVSADTQVQHAHILKRGHRHPVLHC
jgi:hypothetical protein